MSTQQMPIDSQFDAASTAKDVMQGINLSGQIAVVTGGYSGIGLLRLERWHMREPQLWCLQET
jgi:hypothetical protein